MNDVHINGLGAFLPGEPVPNDDMEEYLGYVFGKPSKYRTIALKQNQIKHRHYALDKQGHSLHSSSGMAASAIQAAVTNSEVSYADIDYLATSATLGDGLVPGLAAHRARGSRRQGNRNRQFPKRLRERDDGAEVGLCSTESR